MQQLNRREFGGLAGLLLAGLVTGCSGDDRNGGGATAATGPIRWWDPRQPIAKIQREIFAEFARSEGGVPVEYDVYNPGEMGKALQLAKQSNQLPDVFSVLGQESVPIRQLVDAGWFSPLQLDEKVRSGLPDGVLLEGVNIFDGKVYGLPVNDFRALDAMMWFNTELFEKAGVDPDDPPSTYDDVRAAAGKIRKVGDNTYGWVAPIKLTERVGIHIHDLAEAAGSPTSRGIDLRTGDYAYHDDQHIAALEWWLAMKSDGVLFPASASLDARSGRARWASGAAAIFLDAQFCIGEVVLNFKPFEPKVGLGPVPVPEPATQGSVNRPPVGAGASLWISKTSKYVEQASRLISTFGTREVQARLVAGMNAVPLFPDVAESAEVHPLFRKAVEMETDQVYLAPSPVVRNPSVAMVQAEMKPAKPDFGDVVAAVMTGDITDYKGELRKLSDNRAKERERALAAVTKAGAKVSLSDWAFADWKPREHYGPTKYR